MSSTVGDFACPHPTCAIRIRMVYNRRSDTLTAYHGEDTLAHLNLDRGQERNRGKRLDQVLHEEYARDNPEWREAITTMGVLLAVKTAELHAAD